MPLPSLPHLHFSLPLSLSASLSASLTALTALTAVPLPNSLSPRSLPRSPPRGHPRSRSGRQPQPQLSLGRLLLRGLASRSFSGRTALESRKLGDPAFGHRRFLSKGVRPSVLGSMADFSFRRSTVEPIVFPAEGTHTTTVIWLHGLGDTGKGWSDLPSMLSLPNIKWIFPTAPIRPVTINGAFPCTAWFDILGLSPGSSQDLDGLDYASEFVASIIEKEKESSGPNVKFAVGGFSMGGALSLYFLSRKIIGKYKNGKEFPDVPLSGVVCLSGWLPDPSDLISFLSSGEKKVEIPILSCHGTEDAVVPFKFGEQSAQVLENAGLNIKFKPYSRLGHSANPQEFNDIQKWLLDNRF